MCPPVVGVGQVWIDTYPVTVRNIGNGVEMAVTISRTRTAASGYGGMTTITEAVVSFPQIGPGEERTTQVNKGWEGSYTAAAEACVNPFEHTPEQ